MKIDISFNEDQLVDQMKSDLADRAAGETIYDVRFFCKGAS